jgi:hypothetical protein
MGLLLIALLAPAIQQAREAARKSTSKNNLRQFGLAFHNYHDVHNCLPPGGVIATDGIAHHGWCASIMPFLDSSPYYSMIDFNRPWNDDTNSYLFQMAMPVCQLPDHDPRFTANDGYALIHYQANPNLLHRNSSVSFDDCTAGLANTWLLGETIGEYQPWGYPFNWRPLGTRFNSGPNSFGRPSADGAFLLRGDGSVRFYSNETSAAILPQLANSPPIADSEAVARPDASFDYVSSGWTREGIDLDVGEDDGLSAVICIDYESIPRAVYFRGKSKASPRSVRVSDITRIAAEYPDVREFIHCPAINDKTAAALSELTKLEILITDSVTVSERGAQVLKRLTRLRLIRARSINNDVRARLQSALPNCELRIDATTE